MVIDSFLANFGYLKQHDSGEAVSQPLHGWRLVDLLFQLFGVLLLLVSSSKELKEIIRYLKPA